MADYAHFKNFLYAWCGKQNIKPEYLFESEGDPHQLTFYCELRLNGFDYVSCGEAKNKKEAQGLAAKQFLEYLVQGGQVCADALSADDGRALLQSHPQQQQQQ
eukprot:scpid107698/ scgid14283/ ATP-dependent RNA helicase A-like protein; DEAH box protein 9; Nuclear DNA helicase II